MNENKELSDPILSTENAFFNNSKPDSSSSSTSNAEKTFLRLLSSFPAFFENVCEKLPEYWISADEPKAKTWVYTNTNASKSALKFKG
jgi:hypothetical protein